MEAWKCIGLLLETGNGTTDRAKEAMKAAFPELGEAKIDVCFPADSMAGLHWLTGLNGFGHALVLVGERPTQLDVWENHCRQNGSEFRRLA